MSSVHEVIPWSGHVNYAGSKGGIMQLMKSMAQELARKKIRVNSIAHFSPVSRPADSASPGVRDPGRRHSRARNPSPTVAASADPG